MQTTPMLLFPNFLDDMESYRPCESFWEDIFQNALLASDEVLPDWRDEVGRYLTMGDGTQYDPVAAAKKFGGVSPILWKISPSSRRAVSLTHIGPGKRPAAPYFEADPYFEAKMDIHPWLHYDRIETLRIFTRPSENEVPLAKMLMSTWVLKNTSLEEMEALTDRVYRERKTSR